MGTSPTDIYPTANIDHVIAGSPASVLGAYYSKSFLAVLDVGIGAPMGKFMRTTSACLTLAPVAIVKRSPFG